MSLQRWLEGPPEDLVWTGDGSDAQGPALLAVARPGLALRVGDAEILVPHPVFHRWIEAVALRVLQQYVRFGQAREHEVDWLVRAVAAIRLAEDPPSDVEADALALYPGGFMGLEATLGILDRVHGDRPDPMGAASTWIHAAHGWATKRHLGDRWCAADPPSLLATAADVVAAIAAAAGEDPAEARAAEVERQWRELPALWLAAG
jgi:hypothetical protein